MKKFKKTAITITALTLLLSMGVGCVQSEDSSQSSSAESAFSSSEKEETCDAVCPDCGGCMNETHDCENKCDCKNVVWDCQHVRVSVEGYNGLPASVENGKILRITATAEQGYDEVSVKVDGKEVSATGNQYIVTVTADCKIQIVGSIFTSAPSDTTVPEMNEITNYAYFATTEIPHIDINTENGIALDDESLVAGWKIENTVKEYNYAKSTVSVSNCEGYELTDVSAQVKIRGNSSSTFPKRPLRIKFDKKQKMCGLSDDNKFKNWVLLADYQDSSMLRNAAALYLGNSILNADELYCSDFRPVEVYINGSYNGMYLLVEQQEVKDDNRISVPEVPDPEDDPEGSASVKIGYSLEFDGYYTTEDELQQFTVSYNSLRWENGTSVTPTQNGFSIKSDIYNAEQRDFVRKCMQNIWDIVYDATHKAHDDLSTQPYYTLDADGNKVADRTIQTPREAVEKVVDVRSLADIYILSEICGNMDIGWSSFYMSLDMSEGGDRRLKFEAPWDFDFALGNSLATNDKLFLLNQMSNEQSPNAWRPNPWLMVCAREGWFWSHVQAKWNALEEAGTFAGVLGMIDYYTDNYVEAYAKNFEKWPQCLGQSTAGGPPAGGSPTNGPRLGQNANFKTQKEAATYLRTWLSQRIENLGNLIDGKVTAYVGDDE